MNLGNESEAVVIYEELFSTPGVTGPDYYAMGVGFYNADDFANAARGFSAAAEQNPSDRDAIEMWARSLQLDSLYAEVPAVRRAVGRARPEQPEWVGDHGPGGEPDR